MSATKKLQEVEKLESLIDQQWRDSVRILQCRGTRHTDLPIIEPMRDIIVCDGRDPEFVLGLAIDHGITQIVQDGSIEFEKELNTAALMISEQDRFIAHPISSILAPTESGKAAEGERTLIKIEFRSAGEKRGLLQAVSDQLTTVIRSASLKADVLGVADEMITNAIFNAPYMDEANLNPGASRTDSTISMDGGKNGIVFVGADESRLVVGCHDPYGSLNVISLLRRVKDCYTGGVAENINLNSPGGAGIGTYMVYNASSGFYAAVQGGLVTLVCCTVPIRMCGRKRAVTPKNLHYFNL